MELKHKSTQKKIKPKRPKRSYRSVIQSLSKVWKISHVPDADAILKTGSPQGGELDPKRIKVCTWNIFKGSGGYLFEHDFRKILYESDIFVVQEALLSEHSLRLYHGRGVEVVHAASYSRVDGIRDGVMTLSSVPAIASQHRIICKNPEPVLKTPKVALVTYYKLKGLNEKLMVVNVHATLFRTVKQSISELHNLIAQIPEHNGPVVFAGDFNTFTKKYLNAVIIELGSFGFEFVKFNNDFRSTLSNLDQVFVRGLQVKSSFIDFSINSSDHFPLIFELEV